METLRCVQGNRRKNGHFCYQDKNLVRIYFIPYYGVSAYRLFRPCILDEHEEIYHVCEEKSFVVPVKVKSGLDNGPSNSH